MLNFRTKFSRSLAAVVVALLFASLAISRTRSVGDPTPAGTVIANRAEATYESDGTTYNTASETVTFTVVAVASLTVSPKETVPSASVGPQEQVTRVFRICNTGNVTNTYTIVNADVTSPATLESLYFDNDANGTLTSGDSLIALGSTASPSVEPRSCLGVLSLVATHDIPSSSLLRIHLTARSNNSGAAGGNVQDDGTIINDVGAGPLLSSPNSAALPPLKEINGGSQAVVTRGNPFTYSIAFRNSGDVSARNLVLSDDLPAGIEYVPGSLHLDNNGSSKDLTDADDADEGLVRAQHIELHLPQFAPDQVVRLTFRAQLTSSALAAIGLVNVANLRADNAALISTNSVVVVADPFGTVFAGRGGAGVPVPGASVAVFSDQALNNLLPLPSALGFTPNAENANPFPADGQGRFSFGLGPDQVGGASAPVRYFVNVKAVGYIPRLIQIEIQPTGSGLLRVTERALDSQPIAVAGGFTLVREEVTIDNLADLAFNIPVFEEHGLEITKSVDQQRAEIGDVITYRIELRNPTAATASDVIVRDHLPESFHYVAGTARLLVGTSLERPGEPEITGGDLIFRLGDLGPGVSARLLYRVRIGANAREGEQENVAIGSGVFPNGGRTETGAARAIVRVGGGVFSTRQVIIGRVFKDLNKNGGFDAADKPVAGVRLYLTNGQSVITDSQGLYNFPAVSDGSQVIALDPVTVPTGYALADGETVSGRSWTRLLRTPVGGGAMLRQNFILVSTRGSSEPLAASDVQVDNHDKAQAAVTALLKPGSKRSNSNTATSGVPANSAEPKPGAAGTYEFAATETLDPVAPGKAVILSPASNSVVMAPAMELTTRVALNWTVKLEINGAEVSDKNIGTRRVDNKNQIATFTFVSLSLRPGPNRVTVTPVSPAGVPGTAQEMIAIGRGPVERLEVSPEKTAIEAGGRDATIIKIRAFDKWGNPASDGQVGIESTLGRLVRLSKSDDDDTAAVIVPGKVVPHTDLQTNPGPDGVSQPPANQLIIPTENGEAVVKLIGPAQPGDARLHVVAGQLEMESVVRILPENRPTIMVGLAEASFGNSIPEVNLRGEEGHSRNRISLFYSGRIWGKNSLTLSYDSQRPINRTAGRDRLFQLDPLDRAYPIFGDDSTRFEATQSNSKLYARLDHGRSYAMFGDLDADMEQVPLAGYTRKLTGVKVHLENSGGDFVSVTGAKPDTSFARDVFPAGGFSIIRLTHGEILQGSEIVAIEVRDRRNPEIIISRDLLARSIDYNLNAVNGELFLLRIIPTFDSGLNLKQIVVTYEHKATGMNSSVYTARGLKTFTGLGLKLGFSSVLQRQEDSEGFLVGGLDLEKSLPRRGLLRFAWATSRGEINNGFANTVNTGVDSEHDGNAFSVDYQQPIAFREGVLHARFQSASAGFLNPFGSTVTPGSRRGEVLFDFKPRKGAILRFGVTKEDNNTDNVDNSRLTFSVAGEQIIKERVRLFLGYDHRNFVDLNDKTTSSDLITVGAQVQVTDKLDVSVKREQNLGEADPTYPNQTTLAANYHIGQWTKIFLTQRIAAATITPIGDFSGNGFAGTNTTRETAFGVESRFGKYTSLVGRYQLENGINGTDSFAVIGTQARLPVTKALSLQLGFERGFHLAGDGNSFNSATLGFGWTPNENFKASAHYEFRDRGGNGQLFAFGAAGRLTEGITVLSRLRFADSAFEGRENSDVDGLFALAYRPLKSDRAGLLFSFNHRSLSQAGVAGLAPTRDRLDTLASDGYYQATKRLELYGRFALRFAANGEPALPFVSTLTYLAQARAQYRLTSRLDWAGETRLIMQPSSQTRRTVYGTEIGLWAMPDLRLGLGYNFTQAGEPGIDRFAPHKRGFYFTISSKLSNLFDLFGTSRAGLAGVDNTAASTDKDGSEK